MSDGYARGWPRTLLRIEGACVVACSVLGYDRLGVSWWMFLVLAFVPDLSLLGYLASRTAGAVAYNLVHTLAIPLLLLFVGLASRSDVAAGVALIWFAHIGLDRALGYGLKYASSFGDTHLGSIGSRRARTDSRSTLA